MYYVKINNTEQIIAIKRFLLWADRASRIKGYEVRRKRTDDIFITYACSSNNLNLTLLFSFSYVVYFL